MERYLNNTMDEKERASFEGQLKENPGLKKQLEEVQTLIEGVETAALQGRMDNFHEALAKEEQEVKQHNGFRKYTIAASIAVLIGLASFWVLTSEQPNDRLFAKYFVPDPGLPTTMGTDANYAFYEAMVSYKRANYAVAIAQWSGLLEEKPANDTLNYFIGVAHLANSDAEKAMSYLNALSEQPNSVFADEAFYYLGLAHLKAGDLEAAKAYFNKSQTERAWAIMTELND
ncbi:tetratricopeptide repeat protein [Flavobacteriaceae bacterium 3-367]